MQYLWTLGLDWDDAPPTDLCQKWEAYKSEYWSYWLNSKFLEIITNFNLNVEIHGLADASIKAYAAVI